MNLAVSDSERQLPVWYSFILGCRTAQVCGTGTNVLGCIELDASEYVCVCQNGDSRQFNRNQPCGMELSTLEKYHLSRLDEKNFFNGGMADIFFESIVHELNSLCKKN